MNFYELLSDDHRHIEKLLNELQKTQPLSEKSEQLFLEMSREVYLHNFLEETFVYPLLQEHKQTVDASLESVEEHRVIQRLLDEMKDVTLTSERWAAKLQVFKEKIEHHIREEEARLFPAAHKVLTEEEAEEIGGRIITEKAMRRAGTPEPITE